MAYQLFRLLDWLVQLPEAYEQFLESYHEEGKMAYLTTPERYAMRRSILRILRERFGDVPAVLEERLEQVQSEEALQELCGLAVRVDTLSAFEQALAKNQGG